MAPVWRREVPTEGHPQGAISCPLYMAIPSTRSCQDLSLMGKEEYKRGKLSSDAALVYLQPALWKGQCEYWPTGPRKPHPQ